MRHLYLIMAFAIGWQLTYAIETEPNNTAAQANTLTLNGNNTGKINTSGDVDWWKVTTNNDGRLRITLSNSSGKYITVSLYDNNGTTLLDSGNSNTTFMRSVDGLAVGTYNIRVSCTSATDTASYTIANNLAFPGQANDPEPDNSRTQAVTLNLNSTRTGHIGYYYNNMRDTSDWYRITTNSVSKLLLKFAPTTGQSITVSLYANNGLSLINTASATSTFSLNTDGLKGDVYYVKVNSTASSGYAPYTLTDSIYAPTTDSIILPVNFRTQDRVPVAGGADWWKVSAGADGKLNFTVTPLLGKFLWLYLYDNDRTTLLNSANSNAAFAVNTDGLAAGTYFVKVVPYFGTDTITYLIADTLTRPVQANDPEPNATRAQAATLNLNSSRTGHIGYYYHNRRDTADWYRVTTNAEGQLNLNLNPVNGSFTWMYLYDSNGTTLLNSTNSSAAFDLNTNGLAVGTYFIKINCYYNNQFTPYILSNNLVLPAQANDAEPNNTRAQALTFNLNSSRTGHVGYYYNNRRDSVDWYRVTTNADGQLNFNLTPSNGSFIWLYLYDNDGTTLLGSNNSSAAFNVSADGLAAGTYYIKVNCYYNNQFTPYTLSNNFVLPAQANDAEPDNTMAQALTFNLNSSRTGHLGYYYNHSRDTTDWYRVTTTADGQLNFNLTPVNGTYVWVYLYDNDGTTLLNSGNSSAAFNLSTDGLAAGTYFVKVNCYYNNQFTPYILSNNLVVPAQANDGEPDNSRAQALAFNVNSTRTGHTGYYYNARRDTSDWYRITTGADGLLKLSLTPVRGVYMWVYLYDNNGTTLINSANGSAAFNLNTDGLAAGTYFVKVNCYYNNEFTPYILTDSLFTYSFANDIEPNKNPYQGAAIAANSTTTGHLNFYYNLVRDSVDWRMLNYTGSGNLQFVFNLAPRKFDGSIPFVWFYLYRDTLAAPVYANYFNTSSNIINLTSLTKANYYIRVIPYYQSEFVTYSIANSFTPALQRGASELIPLTTANINVYPNPVSTRLHIQASGIQNRITSVILRDANGRMVLSQSNALVSKGGSLDINVDQLAGGTYFLQVNDINKISVIKKIVIVR